MTDLRKAGAWRPGNWQFVWASSSIPFHPVSELDWLNNQVDEDDE